MAVNQSMWKNVRTVWQRYVAEAVQVLVPFNEWTSDRIEIGLKTCTFLLDFLSFSTSWKKTQSLLGSVWLSYSHVSYCISQVLKKATANWSWSTSRLKRTTFPMTHKGSAKSTWWCDEGNHSKSLCCLAATRGILTLTSCTWKFG